MTIAVEIATPLGPNFLVASKMPSVAPANNLPSFDVDGSFAADSRYSSTSL